MPLIKVNCEIGTRGTRARTTSRIAVADTGLAICRMAPMDEWRRASPARERASSYRFGYQLETCVQKLCSRSGRFARSVIAVVWKTGLKVKRTPYREAETTYISGA